MGSYRHKVRNHSQRLMVEAYRDPLLEIFHKEGKGTMINNNLIFRFYLYSFRVVVGVWWKGPSHFFCLDTRYSMGL